MLSLFRLDTPSKAAAAPAASTEKLTLLIVDDEEGPRQSLRIVFKNDYNVVVASNGLDAIELASRQPVHVAILDILMHGMSGVDLLRDLKQIDPKIEVVMLTAYETLETARQALRHGASDYLNKPFDIPTMRAAVARAAQKYQTVAVLRRTEEQLEALRQDIEDQRSQDDLARTKGEIYASVLHDLNSPLTVIGGFIEIINLSVHSSAKVEGEQLETIRCDLRNITGQVDRCFQISKRYLSFMRGGSNEPFNNRTGVRQTLIDLRDLLARHPSAQGHELVVHEFAPECHAEINSTDLLQILLNLTINALQSTDASHRVEVSAQLLGAPLDLSSMRDGPTERFINRESFQNGPSLVSITITDTGPGIPPRILGKMFEEKFTTKAPGRGTGLGLSIVKRLLKGARGGIHLRTQTGSGAEVTVLLPAAPL